MSNAPQGGANAGNAADDALMVDQGTVDLWKLTEYIETMRKYRLLMNGRNYLMRFDGKERKQGFYQNMFLEADNPEQAETLAAAKIRFNRELNEAVLNPKDDPPRICLDTIWELDDFNDVKNLETDRTFYVEKKWWQFWKKK